MTQLLTGTLISTLLYLFNFCVFFFLFLYFSYLLSKLYNLPPEEGDGSPLPFSQIIHNFYVTLVASALIINIVCYQFYAPYFTGGVGICLLLAGTCVYLCYLRITAPFKYAVISHELPRVPLVISLVVTFSGAGFCLFESYIQWKLSQIFFLASLTDDHSALEQVEAGPTNHKDVGAATPYERKGWSLHIANWIKSPMRNMLHQKVEALVESPSTPYTKGIEKTVGKALVDSAVMSGSNDLWSLDELNVNLGNMGVAFKDTDMIVDGEKKSVVAHCFSKGHACNLLRNHLEAPTILKWVELQAGLLAAKALLPQEGCFVTHQDPTEGCKIITPRTGSLDLSASLEQPPSPSDIDLQAVRLEWRSQK